MSVEVDTATFVRRITTLNTAFKSRRRYFGGGDALVVVTGKIPEDGTEALSAALHLHLFGYEFPSTIMLLVPDKLYLLSSEKKGKIFQRMITSMSSCPVKVEFVTAVKADGFGANFTQLLSIMRRSAQDENKVMMGTLPEEKIAGKMATKWLAFVKTSKGLSTSNASRGLQTLLSSKDVDGVTNVKYASVLSERLLRKYMLLDVTKAINDNKHPTHAQIAERADEATRDEAKLQKLGFNLDPELVDVCIPPTVQSGGAYNVRPHRITNSSKGLKYDTIIMCVGGEIRSYKACVARTLMLDPTPLQQQVYTILETAHSKLWEGLAVGNRIGDAVKAATKYIQKQEERHGVELSAHLCKSFGHGVGLQYKEANLVLNSANQEKIQEGMTFVVTMSLADVPLTDRKESRNSDVAKLEKFSVLITDTVAVDSQGPDCLTQKAHKTFDRISWEIADESDGDDDDDDGDDGDEHKSPVKEEQDYSNSRFRSRRLRELEAKNGGAISHDDAQKQQEKQLRLRLRQKEEALAKLERAGNNDDGEEEEEVDMPIEAYTGPHKYPPGIDTCRIRVDRDHEAVLVPVCGMMVPFHISCIKSVSMTVDRTAAFLRLNFYHFGGAFGREASPSIVKACASMPNLMYIKTLSFKSKSARNLNQQARLIKDMQKRARERMRDKKEEEGLVEQADLQIERAQTVPRLQGLSLSPNLSGRKTTGTLEAHRNGLRFTSSKNEKLDILYSNIKHAIFQPCEQEHVVLIHFNLKNGLLIKKKKVVDIQFYTEVIDMSQAVDATRGSGYDYDEMAEEDRERKMRKQLNNLFSKFVAKIQAVVERNGAKFPVNGFDIPARELGFHGVPDKSMTLLLPCTGCLVSLTSKPPFVLSLDAVEHVHFERVLLTGKAFDMVFVMKKGFHAPASKKEYVRVSMIPMKSLEDIKAWLTDVVELTYTETGMSLSWDKLIPEVVRQPDFYADEFVDGEDKLSGWDYLISLVAPGAIDTGEVDEADEESEFDLEEDGGDTDEDDDWNSESFADEDEEDEDASETDEDEDADDWDTLEAKALEADKRKRDFGVNDDDDGGRRKEKKRRRMKK